MSNIFVVGAVSEISKNKSHPIGSHMVVESTRSVPASGAMQATFIIFAHGDKAPCLELAPLLAEAAAKRSAGGAPSADEVAKIDSLKAKAITTFKNYAREDIEKTSLSTSTLGA